MGNALLSVPPAPARRYRYRALLVVFFVLVVTQWNGQFWKCRPHTPRVQLPAAVFTGPQKKEPTIFLYNKLYNFTTWESNWDIVDGTGTLKTLTDCPTMCYFTADPSLLSSADLVLVSLAYYRGYGGKPVNITYSKRDQMWAAFQWESPLYGDEYEEVDGIFDWVASYKQRSDIFIPYGRFYPLDSSQDRKYHLNSIRQSLSRRRLVTWLVSNCYTASRRDILVKTLQRYIPVDIYGGCSQKTCPHSTQLSCREYLGQNYKFYLAFENSLCLEYVTEKYFLAYEHNMVPVTFGWANYSQHGPSGSYINVLDFDSVEQLSRYLLYLDKNDAEYMKYFSWRTKYGVQSFGLNNVTCTVCQMLSNYMKKGRNRTEPHHRQQGSKYPSFRKWYESLPAGEADKLRNIGGKARVRVNGTCVLPSGLPPLQKWMTGG